MPPSTCTRPTRRASTAAGCRRCCTSVMVVETEIDATGQVVNVNVVRKPAAAEVAPWVVAMIRRASPFPPPAKFTGGVRNTEIWLVHKSGMFQVDTLTEGQD